MRKFILNLLGGVPAEDYIQTTNLCIAALERMKAEAIAAVNQVQAEAAVERVNAFRAGMDAEHVTVKQTRLN